MLKRSFTRTLSNIITHTQWCRSLHYDVLIVGGGVMGSSTAYFLKTKAPNLNIAVVERDSTYQIASSSLSAAGIRQQFSVPENVQLSQWSYNFMENADKFLSTDSDTVDVQLFKSSYMFLASKNGLDILLNNCKVQEECGAKIKILDGKSLKEKCQWLNIEGIEAGTFCEDRKEGWFDGWSLLASFKKKAASLGVKYIEGECSKIYADSRINSIKVRSQSEDLHLSCTSFVNTAGCWSGELMEKLNVYLPVFPRKRYVYVIDCPNAPRDMPFLVDTSGVYCRPEGRGTLYICGQSPLEEEEPSTDNFDVDYDFFYEQIWPILAHRVPAMESLKLRHSWSGFYDYNTFDQNAIIGAHTDIENLYFATGFSGHGIQQAPAIGHSLSDFLIDGKYNDIDLSRFCYDRILDNTPVREINVV